MTDKPRSHQTPPNGPDYVAAWAHDILAAVGKREARRLLADYKARAKDAKVTVLGRKIASERAKALEKII